MNVKPTPEELSICMRDSNCIRNVCILAHVDHGKTTVADSLLATNRLVSKTLAGTLRFLDDRPDEVQKGITMKCSGVSLLNIIEDIETNKNRKILLNLVDTPGHIDFSTEVGAALRVCDGAIVLVDLAEGVCVQTRESIRQAFEEQTKMILLLNKFDRLITEFHMSCRDIFETIVRIIEDCNVVIAELYQYQFDSEIDIEDTGLLFSPETGNVIFSSAFDGWGFTLKQMSELFLHLTPEENVESLTKKLWDFDCFLGAKNCIKTGAIDKEKPNLFMQLVLNTMIYIYETIVVRMERNKTEDILKRLKIQTITRDMHHNNSSVQVRAILKAWKPLAETILRQCLTIIPSPSNLNISKVNCLLNANNYYEDSTLNQIVERVVPYFATLRKVDCPTIAYVSKMFCVNRRNLSECKSLDFSSGDIPEYATLALARVFTGTLTIGQEIFILNRNYRPKDNSLYVKTTIKQLYILFGREMILVESIPAGNFCGIAGLEDLILRTATLSSDLEVVPIVERLSAEPIVRNSIEPANPKDLPVLRQGLKQLMLSDSCVQVAIQETGELVLLTAGDVHLAKCVEDLKTKFAQIDFQVSSPMVALRETIVNTDLSKTTQFTTTHFNLTLTIISLPENISEAIFQNHDFLRTIEDHQRRSIIDILRVEGTPNPAEPKQFKSEKTTQNLIRLKAILKKVFQNDFEGYDEKIWSVGRAGDSVNLLINASEYEQSIFVQASPADRRALLDQTIINAFNNLCKAGPLCEEPVKNCAFIVNDFKLLDLQLDQISPQIIAGIESTVKAGLKKTFESLDMRIMEPMFTTDIQVNTNILGKVYTVISKRHGKVLNAVGMDEQEKSFLVKAHIPVIDSVGFANEIRTTTSGQAKPNLKFSHYEIIYGDPFYEPVEDEDESEAMVEASIRATKLRKDVRRRKGLPVDDQVVTHAEKQRTLKK